MRFTKRSRTTKRELMVVVNATRDGIKINPTLVQVNIFGFTPFVM